MTKEELLSKFTQENIRLKRENQLLKKLVDNDDEWWRLLKNHYKLEELRQKDQETIEKLLARVESDRHILEHFTTK